MILLPSQNKNKNNVTFKNKNNKNSMPNLDKLPMFSRSGKSTNS